MIPTSSNLLPGMEALAWPEIPGAFRPDYGRSLTGIMPTVFRLLGQPRDGYGDLTGVLPPDSPRAAKRVFLLCVDALGFKELAQSERLAGLYGRYGAWITSVFPTITSCALSSIYQGLPPARHGITGHIIWKDFPGAVVDMLKMQVPGAKASLSDAGCDVNAWKREPGFLDRKEENGIASYHLMDRHIVGSGLSNLIYGATPLVPFLNPLEGLHKVGRMLTEMERGWVGLYLDEVDVLGHVMTGETPQMGLMLRHLENSLAGMAAGMSAAALEETVLMIAADHGQSTIHTRLPLHGENMKWLKAHTRAVGNSGRVLHVYLDPGQEERVLPWLREFVGGAGRVFSFEEVMALTGPPLDGTHAAGIENAGDTGNGLTGQADWVRRSLGDLVAILDDGYNWQRKDPKRESSPYDSQLASQHGALSWNEVFVPFICAPMAALLEG